MTTLTFQNTTLSAINQNNQIWLTLTEIGKGLGYSDPFKSVKNIYDRHADEFTPCMTAIVDMKTAGGMQKVRVFSLRGTHLIAMFARTPVAKEFRRWVLDILDKEVEKSQNSTAIQPVVEPVYPHEFTRHNIHDLVWLLFSHEQMRGLLEQIYKPLEAIGSRYSAAVYGNYTEYKRHYKDCLPIMRSLVAMLKQDNPLEWERLNKRLASL